jgi:hypothetical protein
LNCSTVEQISIFTKITTVFNKDFKKLTFIMRIRNPILPSLQDFFFTNALYEKMNYSFFLETTNMIEPKQYTNGHWMVLTKLEFFMWI